jgi:hypothetical protein
MKLLSQRKVMTAVATIVVGVLTATPALAAGPDKVQSIIQGRTGAGAPEVTVKQTVGAVSVSVGRDGTGKTLESYAQTSATRTRMMAVITDRAQTAVNFTVAIPAGGELTANPDGSMAVTREIAGSKLEVFGTIEKPWAVDADGKSLATSYTHKGGVLTQNVDTTNATFPVVADPSIALGYYIVPVVYTTYTRAETLKMWASMNSQIALGNLLCSIFPAGKAVCVQLMKYGLNRLKQTLVYANAAFHRCLKTRLPLGPSLQGLPAISFYTVYC